MAADTYTLLDLEKRVLNYLDLDYDTTQLDVRSASGQVVASITGASSSTESTLRTVINQYAAFMARHFWPVLDTGTWTWTASTRTNTLHSGTPGTSGNVIWAVDGDLKFGSTLLPYADLVTIRRSDPTVASTATGTPTYWYREGNNIGLWVVPSATSTSVTAQCLVVPKPLTADTETFATWLPSDMTDALVRGAGAIIAKKAVLDELLYNHAPDLAQEADRTNLDLWGRLDPRMRRQHYPSPPPSLLTAGG